ncbi:MAG TPA: PAS domain-containing protein, partial [Polyangiales bacterium]|nr:PAS domain-containing protein [Polyangiales bacterium]
MSCSSGAPPAPATACLIAVDATGQVRRWTKDAELVFGHASEHAEGQPVQRLIPFLSPELRDLDGWCRREDGSVFRGLIAALPRDEGDACQVFVVTDITSRYMRGETALGTRARASDDAQQLQAVLDAVSDGVLIVEASGAIAAINPAALAMFRLRE